ARFAHIVPYLVLSATTLFIVQKPLMAVLRRRRGGAAAVDAGEPVSRPPTASLLAYQFAVGVYGGYFGAGIGILMLAALGLLGFTNIHRMNGLKNWAGVFMNGIAALIFAFSSLVNWPVALTMAMGAVAGGYVGSRLETRREGPEHDARAVGIDERRAPLVRERRHRARRVRADAGQLAQRRRIRRQLGHAARELVEIARARVVAQPVPRFHHAHG